MSITTMNLAENVPENIFRGAKLQTIMDQLFENFAEGKEKDAELVNEFFNQPFFRGGESLINKCAEIDPNINFDYIKNEGISLTLLLSNKQLINFQSCLDKTNGNIEKAFKQEIFDKIKSKIGSGEPYDDFDSECAIYTPSEKDDPKYGTLTSYFKKVTDYLQKKEQNKNGKKVKDIFSGLLITNKEINKRLPTDEQIPAGKPLKDSEVPKFTREAFDTLLSFEIGEIADCAKNITDKVHNQLEALFSNAMPTINTIVGEHDKLKYNESEIGNYYGLLLEKHLQSYESEIEKIKNNDSFSDEEKQKKINEIEKKREHWQKLQSYKSEIEKIKGDNSFSNEEKKKKINEIEKEIYELPFNDYWKELENIKSDNNLPNEEKERKINKIENQINELKWKCYLEHLKKENSTIGNTLEKLYNTNFDYSKIDEENNKTILNEYLNKIAEIRLKMFEIDGTNEAIKANFGNEIDFYKFENFYKNLFNLDESNIEFIEGIKIPITKTVIEGKQPWLKNLNNFGNKGKSYDTLPIRYTIKKSDIDSLPLDEDDKENLHKFLTRVKSDGKEGSITVKGENETEHEEPSGTTKGGENYIIEGSDIGKLMYLFFSINHRSLKTETSPENEEEIEDFLGNDENIDGGTENNEKTKEDFLNKIKQLGPGNFENGSEIWLPIGDSELPGGGHQWMKIKISDIDNEKGTFKGTIFGGELKFNSELEGKSKEFKMNQKFFDGLNKITKDTNKIYLQPDPDKQNFNSFRNELKGKLGKSDLSFPPEGVTWDEKKNKFIQKITDTDGEEKEVEVKYFGIPGDDEATYKIEYNPRKKSFKVVSSFNGNEKGKDGKSEKKRFSYKREMDWNNFLIFFTQKGLAPQTEEQSKKALEKQDEDFMKDKNLKIVNGRKWKLYWFSLNNVKNGFKDIIGSIKKGIEKYDKDRTEDFKDIVEGPILKALSKMPLRPSLEYAVGQRQQEIYNEEYNSAWPKIEEYLKALQSDEQFADTFDQVPAHVQTIYGESYKNFLIKLFEKDNPSIKEKRKAAALLLANIQKGGSPYRGLTEYQNKGLWVKAILGKDHYEKFLEEKEKCINALKNAGKEKDQLQTTLANGEMNYIINNVSGANRNVDFFKSIEDRGYPNDKKNTNYIPNPSKRILSDKFATELKNAYQGWFTDSSVNEAYEKISHNSFAQAQADFKRLLTSSRDPGAIANLREMFKLAKNKKQLAQCDKYFLIYMLSGLLDVCGNKGLRKQAYQWGSTASFLPGMLAKNVGHSEEVAELLDDFCMEKGYPKFSDNVKSYFGKGMLKNGMKFEELLKNGEMKFEKLFEDMDNRGWDEKKMEDFEEYSKVTFRSKDFSNNPTLKKLQTEVLDPETENITNSLLENSFIANRGGLFSNTNVARNRMEFDNGGNFTGKDDDEKGDKESFWLKVKEDIKNMDPKNENHVNIVLTQYFNFFNMNNLDYKEKFVTWIRTAYYYNEKIKDNGNNPVHSTLPHDDENGVSLGMISDKEIYSILWYTFKGNVLHDYFNSRRIPTELNETLETFKDFFIEAFKNDTFKKSAVKSKALEVNKLQNKEKVLPLGSRGLFNRLIDDKNNQRRDLNSDQKEQYNSFVGGNSINYKIAQIESRFRTSLPDNLYLSVRNVLKQKIDYNL